MAIPDKVARRKARVAEAVDELQALIRTRWPDATFTLSRGNDPPGLYLTAIVDIDDTTEVIEAVADRLVALQVDERLPIYVVPVHTPERARAAQHAAAEPNACRSG